MIKKVIYMTGILSLGCFCLGCQRVEPEMRAYPLAIGLDHTGEEYRIFYAMPDMNAYTGDGETAKKEDLTWLYQGVDFTEIEKQVRSSRQQLLDLGHVQVLLFTDRLLTSGKPYEETLAFLQEEAVLGSGAYVFACSNIDEIMYQNGTMTDSLGEYLVDLVDKEKGEAKREKPKTLQSLYNAWYNKEKVPDLLRAALEEEYLRVLPSKGDTNR